MDQEVFLPVSLGEALDKLTILDIKLQKIKDSRYDDVKKEYDVLFENLENYIKNYNFYYNILKSINLQIWEMQDEFRYSTEQHEKQSLCLKIIDENDRRFRVKKKINDLCNSNLKEQKGYKKTSVIVMPHLGLGDMLTTLGMVRYLSTMYDSVSVVCLKNNLKNVTSFYSDDPSINFIETNHSYEFSPNKRKKNFDRITKDYDKVITMGGLHDPLFKNNRNNFISIPLCFYEDAKVDTQVFWNYFYVPTTENSLTIYSMLKDQKYVFIHNTSSTGNVFDETIVSDKLSLCKHDILFVNPCVNHYNKEDAFYEIANKFVMLDFIDYKTVIENATYNILSDSSFFCLAINLEILNDNNYYYSRNDNQCYSSTLYSPNTIFKDVNRKIFKNLKLECR